MPADPLAVAVEALETASTALKHHLDQDISFADRQQFAWQARTKVESALASLRSTEPEVSGQGTAHAYPLHLTQEGREQFDRLLRQPSADIGGRLTGRSTEPSREEEKEEVRPELPCADAQERSPEIPGQDFAFISGAHMRRWLQDGSGWGFEVAFAIQQAVEQIRKLQAYARWAERMRAPDQQEGGNESAVAYWRRAENRAEAERLGFASPADQKEDGQP